MTATVPSPKAAAQPAPTWADKLFRPAPKAAAQPAPTWADKLFRPAR